MDRCFTFQWGGCFSDGRGFIFKWGCTPWRGTSDLMVGGGVVEKNHRMGSTPPWPPLHPGSEELKKCPPPSTAVQRIADAVRERKPR